MSNNHWDARQPIKRGICLLVGVGMVFSVPIQAQTQSATVNGDFIAPAAVAPPKIDFVISLQSFTTRLNVTANAGGGGTLQQTVNESDLGIWRMEAAGNAWCLRNPHTASYLVDSATVASGAPTCTQQWQIDPHAARPGFNRLRNVQTGRYLQVRAQQTGTSPVLVLASSGAETELWRVVGRPLSGESLFNSKSQVTAHYFSNVQYGGFLAKRGTQPVAVAPKNDITADKPGGEIVQLDAEGGWSMFKSGEGGGWCILNMTREGGYLSPNGVTSKPDCWILESTWGLSPGGRPGAAVLQLRHTATGQYLKQTSSGQIGLGPWTAGKDAHWSMNTIGQVIAPATALGVLPTSSNARMALLQNMSLPQTEAFYNSFIPRAAARYLRDQIKRQPTEAEIAALLNRPQDTVSPGPITPIILGMKGIILDLARSEPSRWSADERALMLHVQAKMQDRNKQYADRLWKAWEAYKKGPNRTAGTSFAPVFALNSVNPSNFVLPPPYFLNEQQQLRLLGYYESAKSAGPIAIAISTTASLVAGASIIAGMVGGFTAAAASAAATAAASLSSIGVATTSSITGASISGAAGGLSATAIAAPAIAVIAATAIIAYSAYQISEMTAYEKLLREEVKLMQAPIDLVQAARTDTGYEVLAVFLDYLLAVAAPVAKDCAVNRPPSVACIDAIVTR